MPTARPSVSSSRTWASASRSASAGCPRSGWSDRRDRPRRAVAQTATDRGKYERRAIHRNRPMPAELDAAGVVENTWCPMLGIMFLCLGLAVVFASYAGYALWVAWLARTRPVRTAIHYLPDALLPSVTCVMAAANEAKMIRHRLRGLTFQDYPADKLAIIVVSD